jgi:hypothetical protein
MTVRNVRRRRVDRKSVLRLCLVYVTLHLLAWLVGGHHTWSGTAEMIGFQNAIGYTAIGAGLLAIIYLALEPVVRRRWPWQLTAWSRLFAGRWRDPMVGRDLLFGLAVGAAVTTAMAAVRLLAAGTRGGHRTGFEGLIPPVPLIEIMGSFVGVVAAPFAMLFVVYCIFLIVRRQSLAWPLFGVLLWTGYAASTGLFSNSGGSRADVILTLFGTTLSLVATIIVVARVGVLATSGLYISSNLLQSLPLTFDTNMWYFPEAAVGVGIIIALAVFCCWTATGSRRLFHEGFFGDE